MNLSEIKYWIDGFCCGKRGALPEEFLKKLSESISNNELGNDSPSATLYKVLKSIEIKLKENSSVLDKVKNRIENLEEKFEKNIDSSD